MMEEREIRKQMYLINKKFKHMSLESIYGKGDEMFEVVGVGVNWSACGTMSIEESRNFRNELSNLDAEAKILNAKINRN